MNDDSNSISSAFRKLFPGPYDYFASTDGVDDTFVVSCQLTKKVIATVYYWDDYLPNELIARVTAQALCDLIDENQDELSSTLLLSRLSLSLSSSAYSLYTQSSIPCSGIWFHSEAKSEESLSHLSQSTAAAAAH